MRNSRENTPDIQRTQKEDKQVQATALIVHTMIQYLIYVKLDLALNRLFLLKDHT